MKNRLPIVTERKKFVKELSETDPRYGKRPEERSVEELLKMGVVVIDKPKGPTSHQVSAWVRYMLHVEKAGHGGTLDPNVTGVLPIATNKATRALSLLLHAGKEYVALMRLHKNVSDDELERITRKFTGVIYQVPPVRSSVKRRRRPRRVYYMEIIEREGRDVLLRIGVEAGTYIRKLIHDMGRALGVGAHMQELRRTQTAHITENDAIYLQDLLDAYVFWKEEGCEELIREYLKPVEYLTKHIPKIYVKDSAVGSITYGSPVYAPAVSIVEEGIKPKDLVAIMTLKDELIAIGSARTSTEKILTMKKGVVATLERVFMSRDVYPKYWKSKKY
ncbi:MAG TPA: RNA-guided pseudouridylation complex pseudouridine synthase subunit Cbf5 [Euryarchaeota archaeon]|nr:RNA-guided pseudouridylation complex pseudouridine synthase subunit Cbf5 [Euryarchaeota archaeon]